MSTLWVRHAAASAALARKSVEAAFHDAGLAADDAFDAALIASELVSNSVRHARALPSGHLSIDWLLDGDGYLISVTDGGGDCAIEPRTAGDEEVTGRGLQIVQALSQSWGVAESQDATTTVWARGSFSAGFPASALQGSGRQPAHHA